MSKAASKDELVNVHIKMSQKAEEILDLIDVETKGGAAWFNAIRQFLSDNDVTADAVPGSPLGKVAEKVAQYPFDPAEDARAH
ncbi:hypothetical protein [Lysobacter capsici]|uniref:hypothetical protein n=1 Tax=Lysobacter capsici TaxID=435897 RepID=UPI001C004479|nr:hypothetical protein [Lysobacter capsici]QWF18690.1 hypothetical protein KME82_08095 [Lysobacter capsici]